MIIFGNLRNDRIDDERFFFFKGVKIKLPENVGECLSRLNTTPDVIKNAKCDVPCEILSRRRYIKLEAKPISNNKLFAILMYLSEFLLKSFLLKKSTLKNS